ncbi:MAG: M28 family peptidase, partial [Chitinophagales bacterium]
MKRILASCLLGLLFLHGASQIIIQRDQEIEKMVGEINQDSLRSYIRALVGFGTRHTLSTTQQNTRGIQAANAWVLSVFNEYTKTSRGRLRVEADKWTQAADGKRVDSVVELTNTMAILEGTDTADKRILIISGHLDSRATNIMDRKSDAPGANDDGSGVAAVMECARVMSPHSFPITIIFAALSGEEQGLLGSEHLAVRAKQANWNIIGVLNNDIIGGNNMNSLENSGNISVRVFSEGIPAGLSDSALASIRQLGYENDGVSRQLARYVKETGERYVDNLDIVMIYRVDRFLRGGDQLPFLK